GACCARQPAPPAASSDAAARPPTAQAQRTPDHCDGIQCAGSPKVPDGPDVRSVAERVADALAQILELRAARVGAAASGLILLDPRIVAHARRGEGKAVNGAARTARTVLVTPHPAGR